MALEHRLLAEIQTWFDDFAVKLTDLQKPTYVFVRDFYCRALLEFEVDTDNVRRASGFAAGRDIEIASDINLLAAINKASGFAAGTDIEIASDINLLAAINKVFQFLDFGLFDLLSPGDNVRRTVNLMSQTLEFISFADELTSNLDFEAYRDWRNELTDQEKQLEDLKTQVSEVALDQDHLEKENIRLQQLITAAKKKKEEQNNVLAAVEAEAREAEKTARNRKDEFNKAADQVEKTKHAVIRLREELQGAQSLESKEEERKRSEAEKADLHMKYKVKCELKKKLASALDSIKKHKALVMEMGQYGDDVTKMQESLVVLQKEIVDFKQNFAKEQKNLAALESEEAALEQRESKIREDLAAFKVEFDGKMSELSKKSAALLKSVSSVQNEMAGEDRLLESIQKAQKDGEQDFKNYWKHLENLMRKL